MGLAAALAERLQPLADSLADQSMARETGYSIARRLAAKIVTALIATTLLAATGLIAFSLAPELGAAVIAAAMAPLLLPLAEYLRYKSAISGRQKRLDIEYPFFMALSAIIARCGGSLYMAFKLIKNVKDIFPQTSKEAEEVERKAILARMGVLRAMEGHAQGIPHRAFSMSILTTTSVWRSGGDVATTLESLSADALSYLSRKFQKYADDMAIFAEVMFIMLVLLPMGVAISGIADPSMAATIGLLMTGFVAPILGLVAYVIITSMAPTINNFFEIKAEKIMLVVLAAVSASLALTITASLMGVMVPLTVAISIAVASSSIALHLMMREQVREVEDTEMELRRYLRTVVEYRKLGLVMGEALRRASAERYRQGFMKFIKAVSSRLAMGLGIYRAAAAARSWIARMIFWLLDVVDKFGGASPQLLEKILDLLGRYSEARDTVKARTKIFVYLNYSCPFLLSSILAFLLPVLELGVSLSPAFSPQLGAAQLFGQPSIQVEPLADMIFLMLLIPSIFLAFSTSKGVELHPWKLIGVAITAAIYIPAYYLTLALLPVTRSFLLGGWTPR